VDLVRILELDPKWNEVEWCKKRHMGYVLSGSLRLELRGRKSLQLHEGQGSSYREIAPTKLAARRRRLHSSLTDGESAVTRSQR